MQHSARLLVVASLFALAACGSGSDATPNRYQATIDEGRALIRSLVAKTGTPSVSVALVDHGEVVWAETFGSVDPVQEVLPTTNTKYGIGSCSKMFAAAAVCLLADRNLLDLDVPIVTYLPTFQMRSPEYSAITTRMLINHSSGLPGTDYLNAVTYAPNPGYLAQALAGITASRLKYPPGELSSYCNDGFTLVEAVVAAVSGRSYPQFVREEFFVPLAMGNSEFALAPSQPGTYAPYFDGTAIQSQEFVQLHGSGGIRSTPVDLVRFLAMLMAGGMHKDNRILSKAAVTAMGADQDIGRAIPNFDSLDGFGLGWDGVRHPAFDGLGVQVLHKNGETAHYGAQFMVAPRYELGIAIAGVTSDYNPTVTAEKILLSALVDRGVIAAVPDPIVAIPHPLAPVDSVLQAQLAGIWLSRDAAYRIVPDAQGIALLRWGGSAWQPEAPGLRLRTNGWWQSDADPKGEYGFRTAQGRTYMVIRFPGGNGHYLQSSTEAQRVEPTSPSLTPAWTARLARTWAVANEHPDTILSRVLPARIDLSVGPGLQGCLQVNSYTNLIVGMVLDASQSDLEARMMLRIPMLGGRDLQDLRVVHRDGEEWLRLGSVAARPADTIPLLGNGQIVIAADGFGEWRRVPANALWSIQGSLAVRRYNEAFERLADDASNAQYVLFSGDPGAGGTVSVN